VESRLTFKKQKQRIRDITENIFVKKALRETKDYLDNVLNSIFDAILVIDLDYRIVDANTHFLKQYNLTSEDIIGSKCHEVTHQQLLPCGSTLHPCPLKDVVKTKSPVAIEHIHKDHKGNDLIVEIRSFPLFGLTGEVEYIVEVVHDITEHRQTVKALHASEKKYRDVVESANSIILKWDPAGNVIFMNPYGLEFFGYSQEELVGKNVVGTIVPNIETYTQRDLTLLMKDIQKDPDKYKNNENENMRKDGDRVCISWTNKAIVDEKGNIEEILSIGNDITEKKQLEARLQRAQKMEAIGALAGGVAHDLNSVLAGIVSYPDLLLMQLPEDSPFRNPLLIIKQSGEKAAAIVQDLLTLARRGVAISEVVNLNTTVNQYLSSPEFVKLRSFHPSVEINAHFEDELLNILGSPVHLAATVMNLVSNAAESMAEGGIISISTRNQFIDKPIHGYDNVEEGDYVILKVSDAGTGMSPEDMERIFEPFYTKKKMGRSGTGLGMAVVWSTVKDHKGYIDIQSSIGKGTTFTLYFPATREKSIKDQIKLTVEDYKGKGESILVVDDVKEQRDIAFMILTELGYSVTTVSSGEDAIAYLYKNSADLVVLDMIMDPGLDGLDTYKQILNLNPCQKVIIATGFSETERVKGAQSLGAGKYIRKPYTVEALGWAIRYELGKSETS